MSIHQFDNKFDTSLLITRVYVHFPPTLTLTQLVIDYNREIISQTTNGDWSNSRYIGVSVVCLLTVVVLELKGKTLRMTHRESLNWFNLLSLSLTR